MMSKNLKMLYAKQLLLFFVFITTFFMSGCASTHSNDETRYGTSASFAMEAASINAQPLMRSQPQLSKMTSDINQQERKLIKRSWLKVGVKELNSAKESAKNITHQYDGYIQNSNNEQGKSFSLSIRVPQKNYMTVLDKLKTVGNVISENENIEDVTTEFIDNQARLDNFYKLRDRIQGLLDRADRIEDLLRIERELNRTQSEIDRLEGRMKYLKGQVDYASIEFSAEKQKTYGPLGYFFMGIWWGVEKLFVWDD